MLGRRLWITALVPTLAACGGGAGAARDEPPRAPASAPAQGTCRPVPVARLVERFLAAGNAGDPRAVRLTAVGAGGGLYSVGDGTTQFATYEPARLAGHLAERHRRGETLRLDAIMVDNANGLGQIQFQLTRLTGATETHGEGKGAVDCAARRIVVWSAAVDVPPGERVAALCPGAPVVGGARVCGPAARR